MSGADPGWIRRAWLIVGWGGVAGIIVLSLIPSPPELIPVEQGDKAEHILAYGMLMFWFAQIYVRQPGRAIAAALLVALGVGLEYVQGWTGWREFSYADMGADALGVALGWLLAPPRTRNMLTLARSLLLRTTS
jgi:TM2 domain-containing membrane protein YozV